MSVTMYIKIGIGIYQNLWKESFNIFKYTKNLINLYNYNKLGYWNR